MTEIFMIVALIIFIIFSYKKIIWGLAAVIALLPIYLWRTSFLSLPTTFLELLLIALFVVWLLKDRRISKINFSLNQKSYNVLPKKWRYLLVAWLLASVVALTVNPTQAALGLWRAYFLEPMMFFLVFVYTVKSREDVKVIVKSLGLLVLWMLAVSLYQNFSTWNFIPAYNAPNIKRLTGVFSYPNALTLLTTPIAALFFGLWVYSKNKLGEIIYLVVFVAGFVLAALARSDGAIVALIISVVFWLILAEKVRKFGIPLLILAALVAVLVLPINRQVPAIKPNLNPELTLQSSSLDIRLNQWQETANMLGDNFVFGLGIAGYQAGLSNYHQTEWLEIYLYPHNIFLNFWAELGLFGLVVFLLVLISIASLLKSIFDRRSSWAWPLSLMWLTWFVHGLVDVPYFKNDLSILFFIMLGLTIIIEQHKKIK